jgi:hypothetical protein
MPWSSFEVNPWIFRMMVGCTNERAGYDFPPPHHTQKSKREKVF